MASRFISDAELEALRGFPEISREELIRFFDLEPSDLAFARSFRSPRSCLGVAVQLASLGWLGFVPDDLSGCPSVAVERLAGQLGVSAELFVGYGGRDQTRTGHLRQVVEFLGWRTVGAIEAKELDQFLLARAMEHAAPSVLFRLRATT